MTYHSPRAEISWPGSGTIQVSLLPTPLRNRSKHSNFLAFASGSFVESKVQVKQFCSVPQYIAIGRRRLVFRSVY